MKKTANEEPKPAVRLARIVLFTFLVTFLVTRVLVLLIMTQRLPDLYLHVGGNHVHHLNFGIVLLSGVGAYLLLGGPTRRGLSAAAVLYGAGLGLTFDEFGMWLHLGGSYWQRASLDAIAILAGVFGLFAFGPSLRSFRPRHWWATGTLALGVVTFGSLLFTSLKYIERVDIPKLIRIESTGPQ